MRDPADGQAILDELRRCAPQLLRDIGDAERRCSQLLKTKGDSYVLRNAVRALCSSNSLRAGANEYAIAQVLNELGESTGEELVGGAAGPGIDEKVQSARSRLVRFMQVFIQEKCAQDENFRTQSQQINEEIRAVVVEVAEQVRAIVTDNADVHQILQNAVEGLEVQCHVGGLNIDTVQMSRVVGGHLLHEQVIIGFLFDPLCATTTTSRLRRIEDLRLYAADRWFTMQVGMAIKMSAAKMASMFVDGSDFDAEHKERTIVELKRAVVDACLERAPQAVEAATLEFFKQECSRSFGQFREAIDRGIRALEDGIAARQEEKQRSLGV